MTPETLDRALAQIEFDDKGLVPAIAQEVGTGTVLMTAWMNRDAVKLTLTTKDVTYWSRSRSELWRKGATSGHTQRLVDFRIDCDGDTLLLIVEQEGPACHTGERTCFFQSVTDEGIKSLPAEDQSPNPQGSN